MIISRLSKTILGSCSVTLWASLTASQSLPSSFPQIYPGAPSGDYSPEWQSYFQVTDPLPNVTFSLTRSFAGNLPVQRAGHPNDTLFFWAFEQQNGSLTSNSSTEPWGIWLNGGPGSSSMAGMFFENGPMRINGDYSMSPNTELSWNTVADYVWIDQPVGTGFSTADENGYISGEDQMGADFLGFLGNLVKVFPSLATRPLHLTGESYAGTYIPYILKAYFETPNPPVKIVKIAIGDGTVGSTTVFEELPVVTVLETYPQIIGYDTEVFKYFEEQSHLCGYDLNLTYPGNGTIPTVGYTPGANPFSIGGLSRKLKFNSQRRAFRSQLFSRLLKRSDTEELEVRAFTKSPYFRKREEKRQEWVQSKRDLTGRANGTIDPWYGCDLYDEILDYAINFTFPWSPSKADGGEFDVYNIPDALNPEVPIDASVFLNDNRTRTAIHAPTSKDWVLDFDFPFGTLGEDDPSPEPMVFLTDLATNGTEQGVGFVLFSGNDDSLVTHRGTQVVIQNTTFGGIQGFTRKPATPWTDDSGNFAGIVHQERNWTYVLFQGAGHLVAAKTPVTAKVFIQQFVFGTNTTGLVNNGSSVVGGEDPVLAEDVLPGSDPIYYGSLTTQSSTVWPSATIAAWQAFIKTETASAASATPTSGAIRNDSSSYALMTLILVSTIFFL